MFHAISLDMKDGKVSSTVKALPDDALPAGDVLVAVDYSNINYKDGLVLNGLGNLVKSYPHVPGIDLSGTVLDSKSPEYDAGDKVVLTGWRVGELYWGGFAQKARVSASQLLRLPSTLSPRDAMIVGTAGLTAMLSVMELEAQGLEPSRGPVLVTGATGGVGSIATAILSKLGYQVATSSGKEDRHEYLRSLGSSLIIDRRELSETAGRPLENERWAGCIDTVGGTTLARVLSQLKYGAAVAAVGLVGGAKLETTVIPFLLRGVKLIGIDSVVCPNERRLQAWKRIETDLPFDRLASAITTCGLLGVQEHGKEILEGRISGRVLVDVNAEYAAWEAVVRPGRGSRRIRTLWSRPHGRDGGPRRGCARPSWSARDRAARMSDSCDKHRPAETPGRRGAHVDLEPVNRLMILSRRMSATA